MSAYQKELDYAQELADRGYDVIVRGRLQGPDLIVNGVEYELKTLNSANAIRDRLEEAVRQSARVVIDGRAAGLTHGDAIRAVQASLRAGRLQTAKEVIVETATGRYVWTP